MDEDQRHEVCQIRKAPGLYLSDWVGASTVNESNILGVTHIFSLLSTQELEQYGPDKDDDVQLRHLDIKDEASQDILPFLARECDWIDSVISHDSDGQGGVVLIHCQQGISRSAVFVVAYLMRKHRWSYDDALRLVKEDRTIAQPNAGFEQQLRLWERCSYDIYVAGSIGRTKDEYNTWKGDQVGAVTPTVTSPKTPKTPIIEIGETGVIDMVERKGVHEED